MPPSVGINTVGFPNGTVIVCGCDRGRRRDQATPHPPHKGVPECAVWTLMGRQNPEQDQFFPEGQRCCGSNAWLGRLGIRSSPGTGEAGTAGSV